ncbi:MAG: 30S ribosomal protein S3ae [Candidatus Micrarchaeota archaeon]
MAKARSVDRWKGKEWYTIYAPAMLENKEIAHMLASEDSTLLNRILSVNLSELTGDLSQSYTSLIFRITEVKGKSAFTKLIGHALSRSYLQTLVRRRRNTILEVVDAITKDEVKLRVKASIFTGKKVSEEVRRAIRKEAREEIAERAQTMEFDQLEQEIIFKKFSARIYNRIKKLAPIKRVEIGKTEVEENFRSA